MGWREMKTPTKAEFLANVRAYEREEPREPMYRVATFLLREFWGRPGEMADGLGVLLLTWNQAFYRYGEFDFSRLEKCIDANLWQLEGFRNREISSLSDEDEPLVRGLFDKFLVALQRAETRGKRARRSPVAVAKALHLLAPEFFPLWDARIARGYGCAYDEDPSGAYWSFCKRARDVAEHVKGYPLPPGKPLIKVVDEYNYQRFTAPYV